MEVRRRRIRDWMWIALGLGLASTMLIPGLAIFAATQLIVVGALSLIAIWLLMHSAMRISALFLVVLAVYGFGIELQGFELPPLLFFLCAGLAGIYVVNRTRRNRRWNPYASTALGVLVGCPLVVAGFMAYALSGDRGLDALALLKFGWSHSWRLMIAMLVGSMSACFFTERGR